MKLYSLAVLGAIAAAQPAGCPQQQGSAPSLQTVLGQIKGDIATVEAGIQAGTLAFCDQLPALQATADAVLSVTTVNAKTAAEIAAGKAAAAVTCANPTQSNIAALAIKIATAKAAVSAALKAAPAP